MRLLLWSDLHADVAAARQLLVLAKQVDLIVGAGDVGNLRRQVNLCLRTLALSNKPAVLVAGNNESVEELRAAAVVWPQARVLHGERMEVMGVSFLGLGGAIPVTPFGPWSFDLSEEDAETQLALLEPRDVLVCHAPPRDCVDRDGRGRSLGSCAVRRAIERAQPRLVVCGHIHASGGQIGRVGQSPVVNAGPQGILWELT